MPIEWRGLAGQLLQALLLALIPTACLADCLVITGFLVLVRPLDVPRLDLDDGLICLIDENVLVIREVGRCLQVLGIVELVGQVSV